MRAMCIGLRFPRPDQLPDLIAVSCGGRTDDTQLSHRLLGVVCRSSLHVACHPRSPCSSLGQETSRSFRPGSGICEVCRKGREGERRKLGLLLRKNGTNIFKIDPLMVKMPLRLSSQRSTVSRREMLSTKASVFVAGVDLVDTMLP